MKKKTSIGEQEMELLRFVSAHSSISVRDVAAHFEKEKNLARTTILTVMERLRKKGFLSRIKNEGIYHYSAKMETGDILSTKVSDFIERTLGGSVSPLFSYFAKSTDLSDEELAELKTLVKKIESKRGSSK